MAISNFIPSVWSAQILLPLEKALVYGSPFVVNRDYEGEIREMGDRVKINTISDPTIVDYTKNTDVAAVETLNDSQVELVIDQAKAFNFQVDDVDAAQTKPKVMAAAMQRAAYKLADAVDVIVATAMAAAAQKVAATGTDAAPRTDLATVGKAYEYLVRLGTRLSEVNVPQAGRFAVVPPWFVELLKLDTTYMLKGTALSDGIAVNGQVAQVAGFTLLQSNNVPVDTGTYTILAGSNIATSFAQQIIKVEAYRPERRFADAVKGLNVFGVKIVRPTTLVAAVLDQP